jgi:hypothetical protein
MTSRKKSPAEFMELIRQVKYERTTEKSFYPLDPSIYRMTKLHERIVKQKELIAEAEDMNSNPTSFESLGYDLPLYIEEMKAMCRNSQRELNTLLGIPPSAEEAEEARLKEEFIHLSFKAGMYAYVREDIIDISDYRLNLKEFWKEHIDACKDAIANKEPLGHYE